MALAEKKDQKKKQPTNTSKSSFDLANAIKRSVFKTPKKT